MRSLSIDEYQVGIICALPKELKAIRAIFDEEYEPLKSQDVKDQNSYVLGRIGEHNVVAAGLPSGVYGTTSAASVGKDMFRTFAQLRFGLLVGIGGGIPNLQANRDIRLGDVVVSHPVGTHGGVVQYDLGKLLSSGRFIQTGTSHKPPRALLTALTNLRASLQDDSMVRHLQKVARNYPILGEHNYCYQGFDQDCLYCSTCSPSSQCGKCDNGKIIRPTRSSTTPVVHYGVIASGNTLLKNASKRDQLATELGALCVEMEAAGLDDYPCLVVRGICDYADAYKNDIWQEYAALTAAVFTKELLRYVAPQETRDEKAAKNLSDEFGQRFQRQQKHNGKAQKYNQREEADYHDDPHLMCHRAFGFSDYERQKNMNVSAVPGTCRWVLDHRRYREWSISETSDLLWISADPGCGKSVLSRSLIDDWLPSVLPYETMSTSVCSYTICYFFFKDNEEQSSLSTALCSILHQIFSHQPGLIRHALPTFYKYKEVNMTKRIDALWEILQAIGDDEDAQPVICVLDALDECRDTDRQLLVNLLCKFLKESTFKSEPQGCVKWLVTSRPHDDIEGYFGQIPPELPSIRLRGEDENDQIRDEIDLVISQRMKHIGRRFKLSQTKTEEITQQLRKTQNRTYLWLHLVIEDIESSFRKSPRPNQVKVLSLPATVYEAYESILRRIVDAEEKEYARTVLMIIVGARRPLSIGEMALAFDIATLSEAPHSLTDLTVDAASLGNKIRGWCSLFVFINQNRLYLIHQTAKEFLLSHNDEPVFSSSSWKHCLRPLHVQREMAKICVLFLCLFDFNHDSGRGINNGRAVKPFFIFASEYWADYVRTVEVDLGDRIQSSIRALYDTSSTIHKRWTTFMWNASSDQPKKPSIGKASLAAYQGLNLVLQHILTTDPASCNQDNVRYRSPLHWAAVAGHKDTTELLLARPNIKVNLGTPLAEAAHRGYKEIVELLLAQPRIRVNDGEPLAKAAHRGYKEIVKLLLIQPDIDVNLAQPLAKAVDSGSKDVVELLLAQPNIRVNEGEPLAKAALFNYKEIMELLLAHPDIDVNLGEPFLEAVRRGRKEVIELLLTHPNIDVNVKAPLSLAVHYRHNEIIELLLAQPNIDVNLETPLLWAARYRYPEITELLLAQPDVDINVNHGEILSDVARLGYTEIVEQLLAHPDIDVNLGEPLAEAASHGHEAIVKLLLTQPKIDVNLAEPLAEAVYNGHKEIVELLLTHPGTDVNINNGEPLVEAAFRGYSEIAQVLLAQPNIDVNVNDGEPLSTAARLEHSEIVELLLVRPDVIKKGDNIAITVTEPQ